MDVHPGDLARAAQLLAHDRAQGPVRLLVALAAELHAARVCVLAAAQHLLQAPGPVLLGEGEQPRAARHLALLVELLRVDRRVEVVVVRVRNVLLGVAQEVAIQVHVALVHPAQPGEAPGVEGVDQQQAGVRRQLQAVDLLAQQAMLERGAREPLHAVDARAHHQQSLGGLGTQVGDVEGELLLVGAAQAERVGGESGAARLGGGQQRASRGGVVPGEVLFAADPQGLLPVGSTPARRLRCARIGSRVPLTQHPSPGDRCSSSRSSLSSSRSRRSSPT